MIFQAHSGIRYLVLLFGVLALGYALFGMATGRRYDRGMRILASSFAGVLHLQILLGIVLIFVQGFYPQLMGHITMMLFAAIVAQVTSSVMKRRPEEEKSYTPHAVGVGAALVLVVLGIMAIGRPIV
ncbi:MAG: hypothetical protein R3223_07785 [Longimicrobiales bacterium]|nr:hypothetical protein [Longimicrobiales bacterium]